MTLTTILALAAGGLLIKELDLDSTLNAKGGLRTHPKKDDMELDSPLSDGTKKFD
jgi:hypothetical protein